MCAQVRLGFVEPLGSVGVGFYQAGNFLVIFSSAASAPTPLLEAPGPRVPGGLKLFHGSLKRFSFSEIIFTLWISAQLVLLLCVQAH